MKIRQLSGLFTAGILLIAILAGCNADLPRQSPAPVGQTPVETADKTGVLPSTSTYQTTSIRTGIPTSTSTISVPQVTSNKAFPGTVILGGPTADSIALSLLATGSLDFYIEYGKAKSTYGWHTSIQKLTKDQPQTIEISGLEKNSLYYYRVAYRITGQSEFLGGTESTFRTQREAGDVFSFGVQGDSHPERLNKMFNPDLYTQNMNNVVKTQPDFYFAMGDDFSIEGLIQKNDLSQSAVNSVYAYQRAFLGMVGLSSPIFLVNGNHEQAAKYLLDGTPDNFAVLAGIAKNEYYPLPAPGSFYSGDNEQIPYIGYLRDYYAWTWGDALFVVIDPYWHSSVAVDNNAFGGDKRKNMWDITLGSDQYNWFKQTLESSKAKYKFVFSHQVLGTGRGGIELASLYEWGGKNQQGVWEFDKMRNGWEMPVHQLMVKYGVTIFFHAHDHLFAQQELDGIIYQSVPIPADPTFTAFNSDAFESGKILANSGFLNVTVSTDQVKVDYISAYLPGNESAGQKNGQVA